MNPLFATWHHEVSVNLVGVDLPAREAAADGLADEIDGTRVLDLVAVAYGQQAAEDADAWLRGPFQEAEPAFAMRGNDVEMRILASAVLEEVCRSGHASMRAFAAYAIAVAEHRGLECLIAEVPEAASRALADLAVSRRQPAPRPTAKRAAVYGKALKDAIDEYPASYVAETVKGLFKEVAVAAQKGVDAACENAEAVAVWAEENLRLAAEDTSLLWWLLSGQSKTLREPWALLPTHVLAVVAGRELAEASVTVPAPPQSGALLQQLIAANPKPKKPADAAVPAIDTPLPLAFLVGDIPEDEDPLLVARHSLDQAMLLRAWNDLS